jgi:transketolase
MATRVAGGKALVELAKINPELVGGSADLAGSNLTTLPDSTFITPKDFSGRNIHFGVREHAMGAISNGITLHGEFRAFCATFAVFSDYMRPAIRLAAIMKIPTIFIFTHDSYGVGEDGPTHQPIEHAASLRAIPNLNVYRPADVMETFAAWEQAVLCENTPTALLLTRQDLPDLSQYPEVSRTKEQIIEGVQKGASLLKDFSSSEGSKQIVLVASGSEVDIALQASLLLEKSTFENLSGEKVTLSVRVISCMAPQILVQNPVTLNHLLPKELPIIAIEAGSTQSFGEIVGRNGAILGMHSFGESAPYATLAKHFGFTPDQFVTFVLNHIHLRPHAAISK